MAKTQGHKKDSTSGIELILTGLALALLGAGSVMLMVVGLSALYLGGYVLGGGLLTGSLLTGGIFAGTYGSYLNRLEWRIGEPTHRSSSESPGTPPKATGTDIPDADREADPETSGQEPAEPAPASRIITLATAAYGLLIAAGGLIWTRGVDLTYNLLAGAALLLCAVVVWRAGRGRASTSTHSRG